MGIRSVIINELGNQMKDLEIQKDPSGRRVIARGILQTGNERNRNNRIYRTDDLVSQIQAPRQLELLRTGNMFGEAGHPLSQDVVRQQTIDPKCKCVQFLSFGVDGDNIIGTFKGTNNDLGETFDLDLRDGILPAFSYRALGSIENGPDGPFVTNLKMITYDYVIYPSHPKAYTTDIVSESAGLLKPTQSRFTSLNESGRFDPKAFIYQIDEKSKRIINNINESAASYIRDQSKEYKIMKEAFDLSNVNSVTLMPDNMIMVVDDKTTLTFGIEDYISKEIYDYYR